MRVDPVVKADAYGHGAVAIASWLERCGADGLCVATLDEGLALRAAGIGLPILIVYPIPPSGALAARTARLAVAVGDAVLLERTLAAIRSAADDAPPLEFHVEIETGLGRGGVAPSALAAVATSIGAVRTARLAGYWSHLAAPEHAGRSGRQVDVFRTATDAVPAATVRHLAATGGVLAASAPPFDGIRLGLGLYGLLPDELAPLPLGTALAGQLRPIMSLHARPVRVADLPAAHGVGYGPTFETVRPSRVATLPLGYGDGWSRALSNRANALVRGRLAPIVGNVAMDAMMVDVTDVPGPPVSVDDEFVLFGSQVGEDGAVEIAVAELAQARTTNSWEVVTQMARRLPRVYHSAAVPVGVVTLTEEIRRWSLG